MLEEEVACAFAFDILHLTRYNEVPSKSDLRDRRELGRQRKLGRTFHVIFRSKGSMIDLWKARGIKTGGSRIIMEWLAAHAPTNCPSTAPTVSGSNINVKCM